jgi:hypothetical protein
MKRGKFWDVDKRIGDILKISEVEFLQEYEKWKKEIPFLKFQPDWEVKMIPPLGGAIVRFLIRRGKNHVSVYLDCYDRLGAMDKPYWEVYPHKDADTFRCGIKNTKSLLEAIERGLGNKRRYLKK